ncbi:DUF2851 family protein [Flavihumibacter stibioxidans]|uniref:DUF2851 domain-containing protein n=1 Tax=Flavihumibacter stibioxidans TaxID=1834163 RepID=A0ABR7M4A7_9BACT|nr:DUF2851 family protein [Flavihumibacter stibioxidans]MBC6489458.1 hypothetical protein [Flavihumibacter stibioxidans]
MQERLLQFIWQEKYFNASELLTVTGEKLIIQDGGSFNTNQGPDFTNARILLDGTFWAGNIELHTKSSHWYQHRHEQDPNYRNIILHVVWEDDTPELSRSLPTLVLQNRVPSIMLSRYSDLMMQASAIACQHLVEDVPRDLWLHWKKDLLHQRLRRKAAMVLDLLKEARNHWEECHWWWTARHFGGPVNGAFFEQVARSISIKQLARHRNQVIQLEALLLGQANLLDESNSDPYVQLLQREFQYLREKYSLRQVHGRVQKLRMRPAAFPEVRLAQLAMLLHRGGQLHQRMIETTGLRELENLLDITANDFWHYHYTLQEATPYQPKHIGQEMGHQLIINAIVPLVYAAGLRQHQSLLQQRAVSWLEQITAEQNSLLRGWERAGVEIINAAESQAMTELKKCYCTAKRCLDCEIGKFLLNRS